MDDKIIKTGEQVADSKEKPAQKPRKKRAAIGATNESILSFIMARDLHECDAIKAAINIIKSGTKVSNITQRDADILNSFLNDGLKPDGSNTVDTVMSHRQFKACRLAMTLGNFFEKKEQITVMSGTLMLFASTTHHVNNILNKLNPTVPQIEDDSADEVKTDLQQPANNPASNSANKQQTPSAQNGKQPVGNPNPSQSPEKAEPAKQQ